MIAASIPLLLFLGLSSVHGATPAPLGLDAPDLETLTQTEIDYLAKACPDIAHVARSGLVVAYGHVIEAPIIVVEDKDKIATNGIQIFPPRQRDGRFQSAKIANRISSHLYSESKKGTPNPVGEVKKRLQSEKASGHIEDFRITASTKAADIEVIAAGRKTVIHGGYAPFPLLMRYHYVVTTVLQEYTIKKDLEGKESAQRWLEAQLRELEGMSVIAKWKFAPNDAVNISFLDNPRPTTFYIGEPMTQHGREYTKNWQARRTETRTKADNIIKHLAANSVLVYTFSFVREIPYDASVAHAITAIQEEKDVDSNKGVVKARLGLNDSEAQALVEELR